MSLPQSILVYRDLEAAAALHVAVAAQCERMALGAGTSVAGADEDLAADEGLP